MVNLIYLHATVIDTSLSSLLNISYNRLMPMYLPISTLSDLNPQSLEEFAKSQLVLGGSVTRFRDVQVRKCYCWRKLTFVENDVTGSWVASTDVYFCYRYEAPSTPKDCPMRFAAKTLELVIPILSPSKNLLNFRQNPVFI